MNAIIKNLMDNEKFKDYLKNINEKISPINILGLTDVAKVQFLMATKEEINKPWKLLAYFIIAAIPILLIAIQPDYGTAFAYIFAMLFMLFVSGLDKKYIIVLL